jgi:hypothetical protein
MLEKQSCHPQVVRFVVVLVVILKIEKVIKHLKRESVQDLVVKEGNKSVIVIPNQRKRSVVLNPDLHK